MITLEAIISNLELEAAELERDSQHYVKQSSRTKRKQAAEFRRENVRLLKEAYGLNIERPKSEFAVRWAALGLGHDDIDSRCRNLKERMIKKYGEEKHLNDVEEKFAEMSPVRGAVRLYTYLYGKEDE